MMVTNETAKILPHDRLLNAVLIRFLPSRLHPNHVTIARFLLVPFVLWHIVMQEWRIAIALFVFAAFTDALDGSMARVRKQITRWGTVADPTADKLLIGTVVILFVAQEVNATFAAIIVLIEVLIIVSRLLRHGSDWIVSANWAGKVKMLLQVVGVTLLLLAKLLGLSLLVPFSIGTLTVAIVFAVVSLLTYSI